MWIFKVIVFGIPVLSLLWWSWAYRRLKNLGVPKLWRLVLGATVMVLLAGFCWVILAREQAVRVPIPPAVYALVLLWGIICLPLLGLPTMFLWAVRSFFRNFRKLRHPATERDDTPPAASSTRRKLLGATAVMLPVIATFGTTVWCLPRTRRFRIREMTVFLKDLPEALDGMRIAHVTDSHVGKFTRGPMLRQIAEATNRLKADLVLFTGDLIDNTLADLPAALDMLRWMDQRSGLFLIEGNHDLFDDPDRFVNGVRAAGFKLLRNQAETVQVRGHPVQLMGIEWDHSDSVTARHVEKTAGLRDPAAFPILLAHHPHAFDAAVKHDIPLTLAGHTHGGQLMLTPDFGVGPLMFRYWSGIYQKSRCSLVVSNGVGNWFPLRTQAPAEIVHLTLRRG